MEPNALEARLATVKAKSRFYSVTGKVVAAFGVV